MSLEPVPSDEIAAIVTYLEMTQRPTVVVPSSPLSMQRIESPSAKRYRTLFRLVGAPWLWFSRLLLDDAELEATLRDPGIELFEVIDAQGATAGMLELDYREADSCELAFVGLVTSLSGQGFGRWLLAEAIDRAWRDGVVRVHVHTCSLDHPAALTAYRRAGFTPYKRAVERFPDPRLIGVLPADCAPHIPLLGTPTSA